MDIDERRRVVATYLRRCVTYSDASIERKRARGEDETELARWQAFREFTAYSAGEIESGVLDSWLTDEEGDGPPPPSIGSASSSLDLSSMTHQDRRGWLSALLMPRPVVLVATVSDKGIQNISPMSSVNVVSNSPPLLAMSLSVDIEGRPRDTLENLRNGGIGSQCTVFVLNADHDSALAVDATAKPLPPDESEWDLLPDTAPNLTGALAAIHCELAELHTLPAGAKGTLAILQVSSIDVPDGLRSDTVPQTLFQIGFDSVGPAPNPTDWRFGLSNH